MSKLLLALLFAAVLRAQTPAPQEKDALGRDTPQASVFHFLAACHARDYSKALYYLDLRRMPAAARAQQGPDLARQLEDLLDDTTFDITTLSRDPEGDPADGLAPALDRLASFEVNGQMVDLQLERVQPTSGVHVWQVAADSVALIPKAHQAVAETPFEKQLPQMLVTFEILDTPVWRWLALLLAGVALWIVSRFLSRALVAVVLPLVGVREFSGPLRVAVIVVGLRVALEYASPATLSRTFIERALALIISLAAA